MCKILTIFPFLSVFLSSPEHSFLSHRLIIDCLFLFLFSTNVSLPQLIALPATKSREGDFASESPCCAYCRKKPLRWLPQRVMSLMPADVTGWFLLSWRGT